MTPRRDQKLSVKVMWAVSVKTRHQTPTGRSSAWPERMVWDHEVAGSNPVAPTGLTKTSQSIVHGKMHGKNAPSQPSLTLADQRHVKQRTFQSHCSESHSCDWRVNNAFAKTVVSPSDRHVVRVPVRETDAARQGQAQQERFCGKPMKVAELKPYHVTRWLEAKKFNPTTRNKGIGAIKRVLNWGVAEGLLRDNPIQHMKKPQPLRREVIVTPQQRRAIFASTDKPLKLVLFVLMETGARPGEVTKVAAENVDLDAGVWIFRRHKTAHRTGRPRIVYLTPAMLKLSRRLIAEHPTGPLFRNSLGNPWDRHSIRLRFKRLRKKLGLPDGLVAYCFRHTFTTEGLVRGVPVAQMAELLGHTSTAMISAHYSHLSEKTAHLRSMAIRATRHHQQSP